MNRIRLRWWAFGRHCAMIFNDKKGATEYGERVIVRHLGYSYTLDEIKEVRREG
jgi:hypothetical protein